MLAFRRAAPMFLHSVTRKGALSHMITLGIDYGAAYVGIALVRNHENGHDEPLFAATMVLDARRLKEKVENRAALRRLRRTRKTKKRRLRELKDKLLRLGLAPETVSQIVNFCERRGYKSLFGQEGDPDDKSRDELTYRFTREEFFQTLEGHLSRLLLSPEAKTAALAICERVLNRAGDRRLEVRPLRIENRGASRCAWEGCDRVTPRRSNAIEDAITQQLVTYFQSTLKQHQDLLDTLKVATAEMGRISHQLRSAVEKGLAPEVKALRKRARDVLKRLRVEFTEPEAAEENDEKAWKYVKEGIMNILEKARGRNAYCREHSAEYVQTVLAGRAVPFKKTIAECDILSRREQIAFSKLWRYIEARVLPLAPEGIDRIVVERTAFDVLAGNRRKIRTTSEKRVEEMYQQGPRFGFKDDGAMVREEFGGLCAYCGKPSPDLIEREHVLPRRDFFFDSYLNILPACPDCNRQKGRSRPGSAALHISEEAYANYDRYLKRIAGQRPVHFLHYEKKGILNLMRDPKRAWDAERYLGLLANNFAAIAQSQRGPRPFARLLFSKLAARQNKPPTISFFSGRHTAMYRTIAYPGFEKHKDKAEGGTMNHALDAVLLACELPNASVLEARGINVQDLETWRRRVRSRAPVPGKDGVPDIPLYEWCVPGFEEVGLNGYVEVQMAAMNWNQKDSSTHKQDPYGWSEESNKPTKRSSAVELYEKLMNEKADEKVKNIVQTIHHPSLRSAMSQGLKARPPGPAVAEAMKEWLRKSVRNSLGKSSCTSHPGDLRRRTDLQNFAENHDAKIPRVIGVKRLDTGVQGKIELERLDPMNGRTLHRYMSDPVNREVLLAYRVGSNGQPDFLKPFTVKVKQNLALKTDLRTFQPIPPDLACGVTWGSAASLGDGWSSKLETYLSERGFCSYARIKPCCVVCYQDGSQLFIRNFDDNKDFKPSKILKNVVGVKRTPFALRMVPLKVLTPQRPK